MLLCYVHKLNRLYIKDRHNHSTAASPISFELAILKTSTFIYLHTAFLEPVPKGQS